MADVTYIPDANGQNNNLLPWMLANNGGGFGNGLGGWGGGILGFFLGLLFGNGWGGWGNGFGGFGGGNAGAGFLSNQMNNDSGRELLMNAITSQGEAGRAATQNLATMLGQDYSQVSAAISALQSGLSSLALQQAVSVPQIINSIQSGDAALASQLSQCCCENRLLTTQQGYESRIQTIEQTNTLGAQSDRNTSAIIGAINAQTVAMNDGFCQIKERELQSKIDSLTANNTLLRTQIDNANQTAQFAAMLAPINAKLSEIESKQPNTVPVQWPALTAVNTTPYVNGGYYGNNFGFFGNGVSF